MAYVHATKVMSPPRKLVTYGAGKIPSNKIEYFHKTDPGAYGSVGARRRRSPRNLNLGSVTASPFRTPERKVLFNSPHAPARADRKSSWGGSPRVRQHDQERGESGSQTEPAPTPKPTWSWTSAASAFMVFLLTMAGGLLGGIVGSGVHHGCARGTANPHGPSALVDGVCAGRVAMARHSRVRAPEESRMRAVVDGGCTHVCFNDPAAFRPGTLREPDKPTYMLLGDDTRVPVKGVGTVEVDFVDEENSVRYERPKSFYTPDMTHNLIPERKEWRKYKTRVRKEDENMIHLSNGSVSISDATGLYTVKYKHVHEDDSCAGIANLTEHEKNYIKYHIRLGHPSKGKMKLMAKQCTGAKGLAKIPPAVFDAAPPCPHCLSGKMRKKSLKPAGKTDGADKRVVMDVWGPFRVPSAEYGYHYLIGFTHEGSGYTAVYPTRKHDAGELITITKRYRGDMAKYGLDLRILRTDNGPEMSSAAFQTYLAEALITWERSAPYVHEQIGLQERRWGMIIPKVIAMLKQGGARLGHWASAARYAAHLVNMEPLEREGDKRSPVERLTGKPPDLAPVRTYFSKMWGAVSAEQREHKLSDRAIEGRFVGLAANGAAWVLYSTGLSPNKHFTVVQATFDETDVMGEHTGEQFESDLWPHREGRGDGGGGGAGDGASADDHGGDSEDDDDDTGSGRRDWNRWLAGVRSDQPNSNSSSPSSGRVELF